MPEGFKAIFGDITPEEFALIEARRVEYEKKISDFQKRPTQDSDTGTESEAKSA